MEKFKNIMKKIGSAMAAWFIKFFKWFVSDWKNFLMVVLGVLAIVLFLKYRHIKKEYNDVVISTNDTITVYKNKVGELYSQLRIDIVDIKDLKKINTELANEVKNLRDNPIIVTKVNTQTVYKDIVMHDTVYETGPMTYKSPIAYNDTWCHIKGNSEFHLDSMSSVTTIDTLSFPNNITLDVVDKSGDLSILVKSDNPYCQINSIEGAVLSPETSKALKKRFNQRWVIVAGVGGTLTYCDGVKFLPGINITFGYKIFGF